MDEAQFRRRSREIIDWCVAYNEGIRARPPQPRVQPGFMRQLVPQRAPQEADEWDEVVVDLERIVVYGLAPYRHPQNFAYAPVQTTYESSLGDMLSLALGVPTLDWESSPANVELEMLVCDWLAKMMTLPGKFYYSDQGSGGGCFQNSASEAFFVAVLAACQRIVETRLGSGEPDPTDRHQLLSRLVLYCSSETHFMVERTALFLSLRFRLLDVDEQFASDGAALRSACRDDRDAGLIPLLVCASLGTLATGAVDNIAEMARVSADEQLWMHIDGAYGGSFMLCSEFRPLLDGIEGAHSIAINLFKSMLCGLESCVAWFQDRRVVVRALNVRERGGASMPCLSEMTLPNGSRNRALKAWFMIRLFGVDGIRKQLRKQCMHADYLKRMLEDDVRFEVISQTRFCVVCFVPAAPLDDRGSVEELRRALDADGRIFLITAQPRGRVMLRICIHAGLTDKLDMDYTYQVIRQVADRTIFANGNDILNESSDVEQAERPPSQSEYGEEMTGDLFRARALQIVEFTSDYREAIRDRRVVPLVEAGYLRGLLAAEAPERADSWQRIWSDVERALMPGVKHWQSPRFHAQLPYGDCYEAALADMVVNALCAIEFVWLANPSPVELVMIMVDWLARALGLPLMFLFSDDAFGGGVILSTSGEACLHALFAARQLALDADSTKDSTTSIHETEARLVAYCSTAADSSGLQRCCHIAALRVHLLQPDADDSLRGAALAAAIEEDRAKGLVPFFLCATLGTPSTGALDNIDELGNVCEREQVWMHVDADYAGGACVCPEFRFMLQGVDRARSVCVSAHRWLMCGCECSVLWLADYRHLTEPFKSGPARHILSKPDALHKPDYRHWMIPLGTRSRSLKLWLVFRLFGINGLRVHIRRQCSLAKTMERLLVADGRFEIVSTARFALLTWRLRPDHYTAEQTEELAGIIEEEAKVHLHTVDVGSARALRFVVTSPSTNMADVQYAFEAIQSAARCISSPMKIEASCSPIIFGVKFDVIWSNIVKFDAIKLDASLCVPTHTVSSLIASNWSSAYSSMKH